MIMNRKLLKHYYYHRFLIHPTMIQIQLLEYNANHLISIFGHIIRLTESYNPNMDYNEERLRYIWYNYSNKLNSRRKASITYIIYHPTFKPFNMINLYQSFVQLTSKLYNTVIYNYYESIRLAKLKAKKG